jgi:hypothetical protein
MARRALRSFSEGGLKGYGEFRHPFQDALRFAAGKLHNVRDAAIVPDMATAAKSALYED